MRVQCCDEADDGHAGKRPDRVSFAFESFGARFCLTADAPEVIERIPSLLPPDARPCGSADEEFAVLTDEGGQYRFTRAGSAVSTGLGLDSALSVLDSDLRIYIGLHAPNRIFVHAGVVGYNGRAIVMPGMSFTGKSRLVLALMRAGAIYYSDEFAVLDERGLVHPWASPLNLRDTTPQLLGDLERFERRQESDPLSIGVVVVTSYREGTQWEPTRLSPGRGVLAMVGNTLSALTRPKEAVEFITRALDGAVVLEGERGEAEDIAPQLLANAFAVV